MGKVENSSVADMLSEISDDVKIVLNSLKAKDEMLYAHSVKTGEIAFLIASAVGETLCHFGISAVVIYNAGLVHDVGKLYVNDSIFRKDSGLDAREWEIMRVHPLWGYDFLSQIYELKKYALFVLQHHELPDGSGYPYGISTQEIHYVSRIINIADRYTALTEVRSYRRAYSPHTAIEMLRGDIEKFFNGGAEKVIKCLMSGQNLA